MSKPTSRRARKRFGSMEALESRYVLAGVTVITHGFQLTGAFPDWTITMGQAILDRADGDRVDHAAGSIYKHDPDSGNWVSLSGNIWQNSNRTDEHIVLLFDWAGDSNNFSDGWLEAAADSLYASLWKSNSHLPGPMGEHTFAEVALNHGVADAFSMGKLPAFNFHFIGHSRGAVLNSLVTERLAANFPAIAVEQVTSLDPHPASAMSDPGYVPTAPDTNSRLSTFSNVLFADNYYRQDGSYENDLDFNGVIANGAFNLHIPESVLANGGSSTEHSDTHTWYYGTITSELPGDYTGFSGATRNHDGDTSFPDQWYDQRQVTGGDPIPARNAVGFHYTNIAGGDRSRLELAGTKTPPGTPRLIVNGDFSVGDNNTFSADGLPGWQDHGGSHDADLTSDGRLHLGESGFSNFTFAKHNPFYVPASATRVVFDYQVTDSSSDDQLIVTLGTDTRAYALSTTGQFAAELSLAAFRHQVTTLDFTLEAGALIGSELFIDNVRMTTTAPLPGDFNRDGTRDTSDIDLMFAALGANSSNAQFDLDENGTVGDSDADVLIEQLLDTHYGDTNLDGTVDGQDLQTWQLHQFTECVSWDCGNFNGDRVVDGRDFHLWLINRFSHRGAARAISTRQPASPLPGAAPLPPASIWRTTIAHESLLPTVRDDCVVAHPLRSIDDQPLRRGIEPFSQQLMPFVNKSLPRPRLARDLARGNTSEDGEALLKASPGCQPLRSSDREFLALFMLKQHV